MPCRFNAIHFLLLEDGFVFETYVTPFHVDIITHRRETTGVPKQCNTNDRQIASYKHKQYTMQQYTQHKNTITRYPVTTNTVAK
jgi:hypothetical protein